MSTRPDGRAAEAFSEFYRERYPHAVRLAWLLTRDSSRCEDVVQDAFTGLHAHWATVKDPPAYLRRSVVNACRDAARRAERDGRRLRLVRPDTMVEPADLVLVDAVAHLPYRQRAAVILRYWADLPDDAIADALHVAPATVRSLLARAMHALRKEIDR